MFLIASVIIVVILIGLKISANIPDIAQRQKTLNSEYETKFFLNVIDEMDESVKLSMHQINISTNVYDFANFTKDKMNERLLTFDMVFVGTLADQSLGRLNVTLLNFLNKQIDIVLTLNGTSNSQNNIDDQGLWETNFTYTPGSLYVLYISYDSNSYNESMIIDTPNRDKYFAFFDIELTGTDTTYKDKFDKSYNLN